MIVVDHLGRRYGATTAVADVSFTCQPGTVTGFLGPNGAGKSTTLRMLCGLTEPTSGSATIGGKLYRFLGQPARQSSSACTGSPTRRSRDVCQSALGGSWGRWRECYGGPGDCTP
jgi:ABC-type multidrug transport system ATPase subunit